MRYTTTAATMTTRRKSGVLAFFGAGTLSERGLVLMGLFRGSLPGRGTGPPLRGIIVLLKLLPCLLGVGEKPCRMSLLSLRPPPQLRLYKLCPRAFLRAPAQRPAAPAAFGCSGGLDRRSSDFCSGLPFDCAPFNNLYVDSILFLDRSQKNRSGCSSMARRSFFCVRSTRL